MILISSQLKYQDSERLEEIPPSKIGSLFGLGA